jgi:opacity protein-like surface antigen
MIRGWFQRVGTALALVSLWLVAPTAEAVEAGFYMGGAYGVSSTDLDVAPLDSLAQFIYEINGFVVTDSSSALDDDKDKTFSFFGGYRFSRHWAVEASYTDLGKYTYREQSTGNFVDEEPDAAPRTFHQRIRLKSSAMTVTGLAILPLSYRTELYVRGGFAYAQNRVSLSVDDSSLGNLQNESNSSWIAGVGGSFTFADIYAIRLEYQRMFSIGNPDLQKTDYDMLTLGVAVTF